MGNNVKEAEVRTIIENEIIRELLGPTSEEEEILERPNIAYITGILSPMESENIEQDYVEDFTKEHDDVDDIDEVEGKSSFAQLSSIGMSFYLKDDVDKLTLELSWGIYNKEKKDKEIIKDGEEKQKKQTVYKRTPYVETLSINPLSIGNFTEIRLTKDAQLSITIIKYHLKSGFNMITVYFSNKKNPSSDDVNSYLCQPIIKACCKSGFVSESFARKNILDDEYYYFEKKVFARGRGCATNWDSNDCHKIWTEFIPRKEINAVSAEFEEFPDDFFSMRKFANAKNKEKIIEDLNAFIDSYYIWIEKLSQNPKLKLFKNEKFYQKVVNNCKNAYSRMKNGIEILMNDSIAFEAFSIMNLTMYQQNAIKRYSRAHASNELVTFKQFMVPDINNRFCWRPFQLAFILLNLKSIVEPSDNEREIVDLLYFPTGGGKTEAYLGLIAFTIFNRRLRKNSSEEFKYDGGVTVILRYTLRLLTTQQRDRLTKMIISAENIRQSNPEKYGYERISIGFWVGGDVVPNRFDDFKITKNNDETEVISKKNKYINQLNICPFCGKPLTFNRENPTKNCYDFDVEKREVRTYCLDENCFFYKYNANPISMPIYMIDEEIYLKCPTVLLGTVDKFAMLPWNFQTNNLFGRVAYKNKNGYVALGEKEKRGYVKVNKFLPPELIVQDELHLITGPLGTIYGGYETIIEELCSYQIAERKVLPKYIVSTATIKNSSEQILSLYGRKDSFQFPPEGLDSSDSYFIREVPLDKKPFREYLGICASGQSMKTTLLRTFAIILQTTFELSKKDEYKEYIDPYYTLVGYFNSLRELGGCVRLIQDDIPKRMKYICKKNHYEKQRYLSFNNEEITSRIKSTDIKRVLDKLEVSFPNKCIDTAVATNMISVGMDVDRLGLMCVLGQPKQNSEYIQATSRIGRAHPGLVISLYNPYRPRDLSHYENFTAYHTQLYRFVEGTTSTPFAARARDRVLHAIVVAAIRLEYPEFAQNDAASLINNLSTSDLDKIKGIIRKRIVMINPNIINDALDEIDCFIDEWKREANSKKMFYYTPTKKEDSERLIVPYDQEFLATEKGTLQSMRDVGSVSTLYYFTEGCNEEE